MYSHTLAIDSSTIHPSPHWVHQDYKARCVCIATHAPSNFFYKISARSCTINKNLPIVFGIDHLAQHVVRPPSDILLYLDWKCFCSSVRSSKVTIVPDICCLTGSFEPAVSINNHHSHGTKKKEKSYLLN
jgi:hypothetical protein